MNSDKGRYIFTSKRSAAAPADLASVDLAFVGESVDDRGSATIAALKGTARTVSTLRFEASTQETFLDGQPARRAQLCSIMTGKSRILIDATTLGLGEILQVLLAVRRVGISSIDILYAEPKEYTRRISDLTMDPQMRNFSLTANCSFVSVHGFAHQHDPSMNASHVFLLGFEPARVQNAIEQRGEFDRERYRCHVVIGVPAFQPGWEANSIRPHLRVLTDLQISERSITYCAASSMSEAYLTLWELYRQLGDERACFFVSPLGTKPHAVGAALFLLETKGNDNPTSLFYDHPVRLPKRSSDVAIWHSVQVKF